jgi:hypothetical protein
MSQRSRHRAHGTIAWKRAIAQHACFRRRVYRLHVKLPPPRNPFRTFLSLHNLKMLLGMRGHVKEWLLPVKRSLPKKSDSLTFSFLQKYLSLINKFLILILIFQAVRERDHWGFPSNETSIALPLV